MSDATVTHNAAASRFEAHLGAERVGLIDYRTQGDTVDLVHTEVDPDQQGQGVASDLVRGALDTIRLEKMTVVPTCPYVARWLDGHEDYQDMLAPTNV
ncbi:MAG: GNAT family N-acetyltransferase [Ornithinimicrobium sp.]|uniref:GNAT family N-acetyltransferase n=1 Tax=Ornithinimicrobium sp. TaxID=1977084 RepID=UPI003D9B80C0